MSYVGKTPDRPGAVAVEVTGEESDYAIVVTAETERGAVKWSMTARSAIELNYKLGLAIADWIGVAVTDIPVIRDRLKGIE